MALSQQTQDTMQGLYTSSNVLQRPPNTLFNCNNVIYTSTGAIQARKGHPQFWEPATTDVGYDETWKGLFGHPTSETKLYIPWTDDTYGRVGLFTPDDTWDSNIVKRYQNQTTTPPTEAAGDTANYRPLLVTTAGWTEARQIQAQGNSYLMTTNGWFRTVPNEPDKIYRVLPKLVKSIAQTSQKSPLSDTDWMPARNRCRLIALVRELTAEQGFIRHPSSTVFEVNNDNDFPITPQITMNVAVPNLDDKQNARVEIYRTRAYPKGAEPPTDYRLAETIDIANFTFSSATSATSGLQIVTLETNDALRESSEPLYYDSGIDEGYTFPPMARDVASFKGYTIYANITQIPAGEVVFTSLPASGATLTVSSGASAYSATFRDFSNMTATAPNAAGYLTAWSTSDRGTESYRGVPAVDYALILRISDPDGADTIATYGTIPDVVTSKYLSWSASGQNTTRNIKVVVDQTKYKNTGAFPSGQPGICAVVYFDGANKGRVLDLFYYDDVEYISTAGKLEFIGTTSATAWNGTTTTVAAGAYENYPGTSGVPNTFTDGGTGTKLALYYLPGTTFDSLSVYPIGSSVVAGQATGWSLKPPFYQYPKKPGVSYPVGRVSSVTGTTTLTARISFFGIDFRDSVTAYKRAISRWVYDYQAGSSYLADPFAPQAQFYVGRDELAKLYFRKVVPYLGETLETTLTLTRGATAYTTDPQIDATGVDILRGRGVRVQNGVVLSALNRPEQVRLGNMNPLFSDQQSGAVQTPIRVGRDDNPIVRLSSTFDSVYVFKEKDGIWRLQIQEGYDDPVVQSVVQIDDTVNIAAPESVQEVEGAIYFVAYEGCYRIEGGRLTKLSNAIDIEFRDAITKASKASLLGNVRGFKNESRGYYGVKIPTSASTSVTYVYDILTGQWAKWDIDSNYFYYSADGRLISHEYISDLTYNRLRADRYTIGQNDDDDQVDLEIPLTGATGFTSAGNVLTVARSTGVTTIWADITNLTTYGLPGQWYYKNGSDFYRVALAYSAANTITVTFSDLSVVPANCSEADSLIYGVQTRVDTNRNYLQSPSLMKHWVKFYTHVVGKCDKPKVTFEIDRDQADSAAFSGNATTTFGSEYWNLVTLVPRQQGRGNFLMARVEHNYPYQAFGMTGFTTIYRSMGTERIERT